MSPGSGAHGRVCGRRLRVQAWPLAVAVVAFVVLPVAAAGQTGERAVTAEGGQANPPAYVSAVDGAARIDREGRSEVLESGMPVAAGDRLRAENGRVEVTFADGSVVHLDRFADVDLVADTVLHLSRGRLLATIGETNATRISLEAPGASVRIDQPGQYRLTVGGTDRVEVVLAVIRGSAQLSNDGGAVALNSGEESRVVEGEAPSAPQWLAASGDTALERWADERIATWRAPSTSRNYLPAELVSYGSTFDQLRKLAGGCDLRLGVVSDGGRGLAAVLSRPMAPCPALGLDVDRSRSLGLAHTPLRTLAHQRAGIVVLDPLPQLGLGVGLLGDLARLRRLVPARMERPPGPQRVHVLRTFLSIPGARSVAGVDLRVARSLRSGPRAAPSDRPGASRSRPALVRDAACPARLRAAAITVRPLRGPFARTTCGVVDRAARRSHHRRLP